MSRARRDARIRVGVVGCWRGAGFARDAHLFGMELVALCDIRKERVTRLSTELGVAGYQDFDRFLDHKMDAVILANYFHQHAPLALKALAAGKHVMSETSACKTLAEGVALARAVEQSGKIYLFAENYCYYAFNQEMRRLYQGGEIGELMLGEGEYIHPMNSHQLNSLGPGLNHWRNWMPSTYYCTHALGPLMYITDLMPLSVNAQTTAWSRKDKEQQHVKMGDAGSVIICRMSNGATVTLNGLILRGHSIWYRLHGTRGLMENLRTCGEEGKVRIVHDPWDCRAGDVSEKIYQPDLPVTPGLAAQAGHGGGDFFTCYHFAEAVRSGEPPLLDVYRGLAMSVVGIQAWRSALADGASYPVPDFSSEAARRPYADDHWSPFPEDAGPGQPPPSIKGWRKLTQRQLEAARQIWEGMGYREKPNARKGSHGQRT